MLKICRHTPPFCRHGSLFSGIGGFDLAAEWMGWENVFHCECNSFGQKVLKHYWPQAESFNDITKTDFTKYANRIDVLTGGFPCQPYSMAGKRKGKEDDRHLWPEMLRAIREIQPGWVVGENVFGLINWSGGLVFHEVQADLEAAGYEVWPYVLPACAKNAPHRRDRVWFVAHLTNPDSNGQQRGNGKYEKHTGEGGEYAQRNISQGGEYGLTPDPTGELQQGYEPGKYTTEGRQVLQQENGDANSKQSGTMGENGFTPDTDNTGSGNELRTDGNGETENKGRGGQPQPESWQDGNDGISTDTNGTTYKTRTHGTILEQQNWEKANGFINVECRNKWQNFPTQSPVCGGNDGLPRKLDGITFSKWRNESIKAYGNAIVPQVAFEIFKAIESVHRHCP